MATHQRQKIYINLFMAHYHHQHHLGRKEAREQIRLSELCECFAMAMFLGFTWLLRLVYLPRSMLQNLFIACEFIEYIFAAYLFVLCCCSAQANIVVFSMFLSMAPRLPLGLFVIQFIFLQQFCILHKTKLAQQSCSFFLYTFFCLWSCFVYEVYKHFWYLSFFFFFLSLLQQLLVIEIYVSLQFNGDISWKCYFLN